MRFVGFLLVVVGALALGVQGFSYLSRDRADAAPAGGEAEPGEKVVWVSPVVGGIAVVSGLLLLATDTRRD